ncbi:MAG: ribonucleoside-diphosphate reductase subunit alpha [Rhodoferax sp.]|uniref:ribonucleoside-diphosphate reductase subunit alpha n=1 Tax=Rhodoferax sp. TaxID=50421 RepID=UPI002637A05E|nr:ribonucleoside-diphosphate reductase subunit alpha [Rhodoferax sp.]MDD2879724.1 ribonucleoside-diphosphate reductase subunit alpha [Rhodoferax sp.]
MKIIKRDGSSEDFDFSKIERLNEYATKDLNVDLSLLRSQIKFLVYDGMSTQEIFQAQIKAASGLISQENPDFTFVAARYLLADTFKQVTGHSTYNHLSTCIAYGIETGRYTDKLSTLFDLDLLDAMIDYDNDFLFDYYGLQNVVDRYLMRDPSGKLFELPQHFFMRVAMGLCLNEKDPTSMAAQFYKLLSSFDYMASTPTLFNSGTNHSQLSSCYLNTVNDQISADGVDHRYASIFGTIEESARLSKYAGGIGTDWTRVRGAGSAIASTNGKSSGVIPYLKIYNDTAVGVNQGGRRKGSFAPYLEVWHPDFWDFCEIKKEFGDDRLRAHDIFPAAWVADLFMERVEQNGLWSEFQPHLYPELHELHGAAFKDRYEQLEREGKAYKQRPATDVWKRILTNLFETGHPWITFKDECNRRNPQDHVGVIHSSNLCTEITLNTSDTETAVCNLGSVNLSKHIHNGKINEAKLQHTVKLAVRMLDNVIDLNYYPSDRAKTSNLKHRPVGLGLMGETEAKVACGIAFDSDEGVVFSDYAMELISYYAITASMELVTQHGRKPYDSFEGSKWSKGILPIHTAVIRQTSLGKETWNALADAIIYNGIRNSNLMAIAPTATISTITGTTPCIEPIFEIERSEKNMSGQFKVVDPCVKYRRPDLLKTVWEIDPIWILKSAAVRQKWIDQSQSVNIFVKQGTKGRDLATIYMTAWKFGLKTTYYLRGQTKTKETPKPVVVQPTPSVLEEEVKFCSLDNPDCESCQ